MHFLQDISLAAFGLVAVVQDAQEQNVRTAEWVAKDPDNRWGGTGSTDVAVFIENGEITPEIAHRNELESAVWDAGKDATGIRPRWIDFKAATNKQLEQELEYFINSMKSDEEQEEEQEREWKAKQAEMQRTFKAQSNTMALAFAEAGV